jgi:HlyD family secretion protein
VNRRLKVAIITAAVVGALAGAGYVAYTRFFASSDVPTLSYSTVTVGKGAIAAQVTANGTLSARSTVQVGAQVSGRVVELHADFNAKVKKGQLIAKLDASVLLSQIEQSEANLAVATANVAKNQVALADADRQLTRQKSLRDQQLVAGAVVEAAEVARDTAKASLAASKATVNQARANVNQARLNLSYATIYSPVDGVVLSRNVDVGQTVAASLQAPVLFTIAEDLAFMQIDTAVTEGDVGRLVDGMKATFAVDAYPGKTFDGVVRQVRNAPTTTQGVVTYDAVIDVDNSSKDRQLRPGMTANVTFVLDSVADVVKIPNAALRFKPSMDAMRAMRQASGQKRGGRGSGSGGPGSGSGSGGGSDEGRGPFAGVKMGPNGPDFGDKKPVWKLVDGKPKMTLIKPGLTDGSSTQLLEGELEAGDLLITEVTGVPTTQRKIGAF